MADGTKSISGFGGSVIVDASTSVEVASWTAELDYQDYNATHLGSSGFVEEKWLTRQITGTFEAHEAILPNTSHRWVKLQLGSGGSGLYSIRGKMRHTMGVDNPQEKVTFTHAFKSTGIFTIVASS